MFEIEKPLKQKTFGSFARFSSFQRTAGRFFTPGMSKRDQSGSPLLHRNQKFHMLFRHNASILAKLFSRHPHTFLQTSNSLGLIW